MADVLVLVHTVPPLIEVFNRLAAELLPGVRVLHVLDEPLLEQVRQRGHLAEEDAMRLGTHVREAAQIGAAAVLVTCSTVSPCVDAVRQQAEVPVLRIDEVMIREAIMAGQAYRRDRHESYDIGANAAAAAGRGGENRQADRCRTGDG